VTGFLVGGGIPSLLAGVGFLVTVAYVAVLGPPEPVEETVRAEAQPEAQPEVAN
jgi:hypothetical protein